jgi:acetylglutamate kinase
MSKKKVLIKLGGAALQDDAVIHQVASELRTAHELGSTKFILVHGGGPAINEELTRRGINWEFLDGQRITTPEMMLTIESVLSGQMNRKITRAFLQAGLWAVGLSGVDGATLTCKQADSRLGLVGVVDHAKTHLIDAILQTQVPDYLFPIPVVAPVGCLIEQTSNSTQLSVRACNINADWAATQIATAAKVDKLIFLTDQDGILDQNKTHIAHADRELLQSLIRQEVVKGGMLAKVQTVMHALDKGVPEVRIANARKPGALLACLRNEPAGTVMTNAQQPNHLSSKSTRIEWSNFGL